MNTNAKHSPAPWRIDGETIRADNGWEICNPFQTDAPTGLVECGANARLIASSPALLEALRDCLSFWQSPPDGFGCNASRTARLEKIKMAARAAISQAEGGAQ